VRFVVLGTCVGWCATIQRAPRIARNRGKTRCAGLNRGRQQKLDITVSVEWVAQN
jgi:hypothetical protein